MKLSTKTYRANRLTFSGAVGYQVGISRKNKILAVPVTSMFMGAPDTVEIVEL